MSTVDPDAARRARASRTPTERDQLLPGVLALLGAAALAVSIASMGRTPDDWSVEQSTLSLLLGAAGSLIGALAVIGGLLGWVRTTTKNPRLLGWSVPIGLALVGAGLGLLLMGQTVVALSLLGVGVVLGALGVVVRGRRSARLDVEEEIMRTSTPVTGQVTNQGYTHFGDSSRILTSVTYAFSDAQGTRRFVQRSAMIEADDPILEGESVDVWYDRQDPSNEKRIVVRRRR
ncbi:DUF3592 domain-containing protein [Streptomyces sp. AC495_CC817]|uniref:DUF3592 domain-containing protein n=1 Tax=Streptomyces sp. AC495_CC817 TaxID=2823900 RepID=UPI001C25991F|nr:DUF3592 domain-containing protein [Streptomyces sp. AC495_CC817]